MSEVDSQAIAAALQALVASGRDVGLSWSVRRATAWASGDVILDGDPDLTLVAADSMIGTVLSGTRVYCLLVPPAAIYVIGRVSETSQRVVYFGKASADFACNTAAQLISGTLLNVVAPVNGCTVEYTWAGDWDSDAAATTIGILDLMVDGANPTGSTQCIYQQGTANDTRFTLFQQWVSTLDAGTHTVQLRLRKAAGTDGAVLIKQDHTNLKVVVTS